MRKALTISAIALASSMALGGAATAFAADAPTPTPTPTSSPGSRTAPHTAPAGLKLSTATAKPGDSVQFQMEVPDGSANLSVSSKALNDVKMTDGRGGTAKVAEVPDGSYGISLTGTGPDGAELQATAQLSVKAAAPKPTPQAPSLNLSTDFGHPGDKVVVAIRTTEKNAYVRSDAFGGQVNLKSDGKGTWTGTAIVAKDVKTGYYGVQAFAGGKQFDTVKFSTEATGGKDVKPHTDPRVEPLKPLKPSEHKKPQGSVNTGQAPAGFPADA
ncbi:hypothetical protein AB0D54_34630 [Streptomyces xanthophaeus]|uniref:hypothetical protein n=1 Tax=Streptomyces xanthophaeus TaxID=67385 RepID=UPI003420E641